MPCILKDVEREAYFNWQRRLASGKKGDALSDWLEAERRLTFSSEEIIECAERTIRYRDGHYPVSVPQAERDAALHTLSSVRCSLPLAS